MRADVHISIFITTKHRRSFQSYTGFHTFILRNSQEYKHMIAWVVCAFLNYEALLWDLFLKP
jgi:hypothetical protein